MPQERIYTVGIPTDSAEAFESLINYMPEWRLIPEKNVSADSLSKLGAEGGKARANKLSSQRRSEIARNAANARWNPQPQA